MSKNELLTELDKIIIPTARNRKKVGHNIPYYENNSNTTIIHSNSIYNWLGISRTIINF